MRTWSAAGAVACLLVVACAGRLIHLDSDPSIPTWIGYVVDEGRWNETARNLALFGDANIEGLTRLHLYMSPGYQAVNYVLFLLFGVDFWSARLFSAVAGVLVVLAVFVALRRHVTALALAFGVVVLGFETNLFWTSRIALPEMPAVLATLVAFLLLVVGRNTLWSAVLSGFFAAGAVPMKASSVLVLLAFPLIALAVPQGAPVRLRVLRSIGFVAGFMLPAVAGMIGMLALGYLNAEAIGEVANRLRDFVAFASPYVAVSRFFDATEFEMRNMLLLGVWFCSWRWFYRESRAPSVAGEVYLASGIWGGWWLIVWSANTYLPGRYLVHFIVPATIHIMAGLSLGGPGTAARIAAALDQGHRFRRIAILSWLVLPSAIIMTSVIAGVAELAGWNAEPLSQRIAVILALTGLIASFMSHRPIHVRSIAGFLLFPAVMGLAWLGGRELGLFGGFWAFDSAASLAMWSAAAGAVLVLCFIAVGHQRMLETPAIGVAAVAVLAAIFLAQAAPPVLLPTYSLRAASRDLPRHLPSGRPIATVTAASLFLENGLRYREVTRSQKQFHSVVIFEHGGVARRFLDSERAANLVRVQTYPLTISPKYRTADGSVEVPIVGAYRAK